MLLRRGRGRPHGRRMLGRRCIVLRLLLGRRWRRRRLPALGLCGCRRRLPRLRRGLRSLSRGLPGSCRGGCGGRGNPCLLWRCLPGLLLRRRGLLRRSRLLWRTRAVRTLSLRWRNIFSAIRANPIKHSYSNVYERGRTEAGASQFYPSIVRYVLKRFRWLFRFTIIPAETRCPEPAGLRFCPGPGIPPRLRISPSRGPHGTGPTR